MNAWGAEVTTDGDAWLARAASVMLRSCHARAEVEGEFALTRKAN